MTTDHHLDETDFLVVDVETTGLSPTSGDRVCEIGVVKLHGGAVVDSFGSLVDPQREISPGAYNVNRISAEMLADAPVFPKIAGKLQEMMKETVLVAYNAGFDLSFIESEFSLLGSPRLDNVVVDALTLARQLLPGLRKYPQEHVASIVGIPFPVKHRALEDAMTTAKLFTMFTTMLKAHGCCTIGDLFRRDLARTLFDKRMGIVNHALATRSQLWIKYLSPMNAEITDRVVTPKDCVAEQSDRKGATYLVAYCHSAKAERNFRIDRILDLRLIHPIANYQ
ncbi:MAG: WYL domain-containing protein [Ignavibacteriae bacterium]|nr:WYL domain-containing protein [Ignavibacteria bacterium]MBI3363995.1 WYL domain-containing protein [Ignavibacteriota bacterium]